MRRGKESGQSAVELAMLLPILLLMVLGCLDLGRAFAVRMALANGVREGARYGAMFPLPPAGHGSLAAIYNEAQRDIIAQGLSAQRDSLALTTEAPGGWVGGQPVKVTAVYSLPMMTSYLFGGRPLVIKTSAEMMILEGE